MLKHNIIIAFRSFKRYKSTFFINLIGLAGGLASVLLIYLWVNDELNMDNFNEKDSARHVQVLESYPLSTGIKTGESTPGPLTEALGEEMPEVAYAVPINIKPFYEGILSFDEQKFRAMPQFVGDGYFNIFPCDFLAGDKATALADKNSIVVSKKLAIGLFEDVNNAIGKTVLFKNRHFDGNYIISGVFDANTRASQKFDALFNHELFLERRTNMLKWNNGGTLAHLVLDEGVDLDQFNEKIKDFLKTKINNSTHTLYAQPYSEKYLYGQYENGFPVEGRIVYVRLFSIIALFILAIACINYMNLSTAQASRRIKEIGVKKAIGAQRKSLMHQYFSESIFMTFLAVLVALGIVAVLLPQFNEITDKTLSITQASGIALPVLLITLATGLISGIYPGLYLSKFKPVLALKGKLGPTSGAIWIRKGLVIFQFTISIILITAVMVIYQQMNFVQTMNLGYNKDQIVSFPKEGKLRIGFETFISEVQAVPGVVNASFVWGDFPGRIGSGDGFQWKGMSEEDLKIRFYSMNGGYDLIELLGMELKEGRSFSREFPTDKKAIIINEAAAAAIKYENPIGEKFYDGKMRDIIGVVKDFHFQSLQEEIQPVFFTLNNNGSNFLVKIQAGLEKETLQKIEELHSDFNPGYPFDFKFIDENYQALYASEERVAILSKFFAGIAIVISCLGLLALTAFSTESRFKEIAIRKVLGASRFGLTQLISGDFIALILIAITVALPIGYYFMKNWLESFAYRIELDPLLFISAGVLMLVLAWLTIVGQTAKSARVNVTDSLRGE